MVSVVGGAVAVVVVSTDVVDAAVVVVVSGTPVVVLPGPGAVVVVAASPPPQPAHTNTSRQAGISRDLIASSPDGLPRPSNCSAVEWERRRRSDRPPAQMSASKVSQALGSPVS
ncbi:MAG: hypothetical protein JW785_01430 [Acidimicrobiia bacterium]|nr:hypothetical protein [Acidimicrobiia bacterium]